MAEYVEKERVLAFLEAFAEEAQNKNGDSYIEDCLWDTTAVTARCIANGVKALKTADVRSIVRSEWKINRKTNIAVCKSCSHQYMMGAPWHEYPTNFCPNCGADMRSEEEID